MATVSLLSLCAASAAASASSTELRSATCAGVIRSTHDHKLYQGLQSTLLEMLSTCKGHLRICIGAVQVVCEHSSSCCCLARGTACGNGMACSLRRWPDDRAVRVLIRHLSTGHGASHLLYPLRAAFGPPTCARASLIRVEPSSYCVKYKPVMWTYSLVSIAGGVSWTINLVNGPNAMGNKGQRDAAAKGINLRAEARTHPPKPRRQTRSTGTSPPAARQPIDPRIFAPMQMPKRRGRVAHRRENRQRTGCHPVDGGSHARPARCSCTCQSRSYEAGRYVQA